MKLTTVLLLLLSLVLPFSTLLGELSAAPKPKKEKPVRLTRQGILKGVWSGNADVEKGKSQGNSWPWRLEFARGDLTQASGTAINTVVRVEADKFNLTRPFKMKIVYSPAEGMTYEILTTAKLNPTCTEMTGTFKNVMGTGSFTLKKENCAPPPHYLKGSWNGTFTGKKGKLARKTVDCSIDCPAGAFLGAEVKLGELEVQELVPSVWDVDGRSAILFLTYLEKKAKKPRVAELAGRFSEDFSSFTGTYKGKQLGSGTFELNRG